MEDYYPDEIALVFEAWGEMHGVETEREPEQVGVMEFLNM